MSSKYSHYTDFLKDRHFIRWQLMPDKEIDEYWQNFIEQHPEVNKEIHKASMFLRKEGLNKNSLKETEQKHLLEKIRHTIQREEQKKRRKITWWSVSGVAVATIALAIALLTPSQEITTAPGGDLIVGELLNSKDIQIITKGESISFQNDITVTLSKEGTAEITQSNNETSKIEIARDKLSSLVVPYGKRSTLTLADGSKVWLNSGSVLEFPAQFSDKRREVRLVSGEMYIEVAHDEKKPFHVETSRFNVRIYGTKFNLSTYTGIPYSLVLVEGSVGLRSNSTEELILKPNEQAIFSESGVFETRVVDAAKFTSWKDGYLTFDKTLMTEVLQQISRYYNLSFNFESDVNLWGRTCTGKIFLSENIDNVMTTIALLSSTNYDKQGDKIYITNQSE